MVKYPPDERVVYLALRNVFKGTDAFLRKQKKIRQLIQKHQNDTAVKGLIQEYSLDSVTTVAQALLEKRLFETTVNAKIRFPEVFEVSPAQSAERAVSEAEAARSEANAIKIVAEGCLADPTPTQDAETVVEVHPEVDKGKQIAIPVTTKSPSLRSTVSAPSLYPVYLPFRTQHQLLGRIQIILEEACYAFAQVAMRDALPDEWVCPESVELNRWAPMFLKNQSKFDPEDILEVGKPLRNLFDSIAQLRHTVVHRLRVTANKIEQFILDAESLARLLRDEQCARTLCRLRRETLATIDDFKRNKDLLESRVNETLKSIAAQRAELDRLEESAVEDMLKEDKEYQAFAGLSLEQTIASPETAIQSVATTESDTGSEADIFEESSEEQDNNMMLKKHTDLD